MKTALNGKSVLENVGYIIKHFQPKEIGDFIIFSKKNRRKTVYGQIFEIIYHQIREDTNQEFSPEKILEIVRNEKVKFPDPEKNIEFLFGKLLEFLAEVHLKTERKQWQIEANRKIVEIEALIERDLFDIAAQEIKKLENDIEESKIDLRAQRNDDYSIFLRLANLKYHLLKVPKPALKMDEIDEMLHNLLQLGDYFYGNGLKHHNMCTFDKHKYLGYQFLADFFLNKDRKQHAMQYIKKTIDILTDKIEESTDDTEKFFLATLRFYWGLKKNSMEIIQDQNIERIEPLSDLELLKRFDLFESYPFCFLKDNGIIMALFAEDLIFKLQASMAIQRYNNKEKSELIKENIREYGSYLYPIERIKNFEVRKEFNHCIVLFILKKYTDCSELISKIEKPKGYSYLEKEFKYDLKLLDLLAKIKTRQLDHKHIDIEDNINSLLKYLATHNSGKFEKMAMELLSEYANCSYSGTKSFRDNHKSNLNELIRLKKNTEPMHHLVLSLFSS
jgi:hypothetical protein